MTEQKTTRYGTLGLALALLWATPVWADESKPAEPSDPPRAEEAQETDDDDMGIYVPPAQGAPATAIIGAVRGGDASDVEVFRAMIPRQIALTVSPQPTIYLYLSHEVKVPMRLAMTNLDTYQTKFKAIVPGPHAAGLIALNVADHDFKLEPNVEYEWTATLVFDEKNPSQNLTTGGWLKLVEPSEDLVAQLGAADTVRARVKAYAGEGIWYDALHTLNLAIAAAPEDDRLKALRKAMLSSDAVGLHQPPAEGGKSIVERME